MKKVKSKVLIIVAILIIAIIAGVAVILNNSGSKYELEKVEKYSYFKLYKNEKYGVIDAEGNIIIQPEYTVINIPNPSKPIFFCYYDYDSTTGEYKTKALNEKNEEIFTEYEQVLPLICEESTSDIPFEKSVLQYKENGKYGVMDFNGKKITKSIYEEIKSLEYKEGTLLVKQEGKYGLINMKGKQIVKPQYDEIKADGYYTNEAEYMDSGYIVQTKTQDGYRYGYINKDGKLLLNAEYNEIDRVTDIEDDKNVYLLVSKNGQYGIAKNKKLVIDCTYDEIEYNKTDKLFVVEKNSKQGIINIEGKQILPTEYDYIYCAQNILTAKKGEDTETFDLSGNKQENPKYESLIDTSNENYIITVDNDEKFGVINKEGNILIKNNYQYIEYAFGKFFIATSDGKVGVLNDEGKQVISFSYDIIQRVKDKNAMQAIISSSNTIEIYNSNAQKTTTIKDATLYTNSDYIKLLSSNDMKYLDNNGNIISNKEIFKENTLFAYSKDGKWGFVDANGKEIVQAKYDMVTEYSKYGYAGIKINGKWGVVNREGQVIKEPTYKIDWNEPEFINKYCKLNFGYGFEYYTDEI